jgi:hypothetical protein
MASNARPNRTIEQRAGLEDRAVRTRAIYEYEIPDEDGLHSEVTQTFGSLRKIGVRLLTPLEDKNAARACRGDPMQLAFELAKRSIAEVTNERGDVIEILSRDAMHDELWGQMHPKIRSMVIQAYADNASPEEQTTASFLNSRKIKA